MARTDDLLFGHLDLHCGTCRIASSVQRLGEDHGAWAAGGRMTALGVAAALAPRLNLAAPIAAPGVTGGNPRRLVA